MICTPEAFPDRTLATSPVGLFSISSPAISATAYPRAFFSLLIPCAVTTTSSKVLDSDTIVTLIMLSLPTDRVTVVIPTKLYRRLSPVLVSSV